MALAASFGLPKGLLRFTIQFKSISLILAGVCCFSAEYTTDKLAPAYFETVMDKHQEYLNDESDESVTHLGLSPFESPLILYKMLLHVGEAALVGFSHNATLVFLYELFLCTCRCEKRVYSWIGCLARIAVASAVSLVKDVMGRTVMFFFIDVKRGTTPTEFNLILYRVFDASYSFLLTIAVGFFSVRVAYSTTKSVQFQQNNSSAQKTKSSCGNPLFRIVISVMLIHCAIFAYDLAMVVGYMPDKEDKTCLRLSPDCFLEMFLPFWTMDTPHKIVQQFLSLMEILFIYLSRWKMECCWAATNQ